ncbi:D-amino-acid transaminase [Pseudogracilibacillus auburnensis]|uniref:D-alanine aminotransferase n=1 Tax=Pseudogracilibacillus auburnensis TaxID=1494959 RepID=A0A2V3VVR6_9BACI|nr:D-amino-acid transaminase [Pseudogracilibacillus auburnensis]PXW85094.1 D-alanine transaminase [Pseudogracilibacillus auburnensis]
MNQILLNGNMIKRRSCIDIEDRGYQFGDGIYEVVGIYGGKLFLMDEHLQRLKRSARELSIKLPFTMADIKQDLIELTKVNDVIEGLLYLQITRGVAPRTHELPVEKVEPMVVAYTKELGDLTELQDMGSTAILQEDIRWLRCDVKTLNLLPNTMAKQRAVEQGAVEAILNRGEVVTEASSSNVFIIKDGIVYTHPANNFILNGITRQKVIQILQELNILVKEVPYTVTDLLSADEVFITATKLDVVPINSVDGHDIGTGKPGMMTIQILEAMRQLTARLQVQ